MRMRSIELLDLVEDILQHFRTRNTEAVVSLHLQHPIVDIPQVRVDDGKNDIAEVNGSP
jgi:hypothetical protein